MSTMTSPSLFPFWFPDLTWTQDPNPNSKWGKNPYERSIPELLEHGVINLDKPQGPTSHDVVNQVKQILKVSKTGHRGTLDPQVSGILPVALGKATKLLQALLLDSKEYVTVMTLHAPVPEAQVKQVLQEFQGPVYQTPPLASSVKKVLRVRKIYKIEFLEQQGNNVLMRVECESGTYIRTLCVDIGRVLGVGAHMAELRRTKSACFRETDRSTTLNELFNAMLLYEQDNNETLLREIVHPMERMLLHLKKIVVSDNTVSALCHGAPLAVPGIIGYDSTITSNDLIAIYTQKGEVIGLATAIQDASFLDTQSTGVFATMNTIVMDRLRYPKLWGSKSSNE